MKLFIFALLCMFSVSSLAEQFETSPASVVKDTDAESPSRALSSWSPVGTWDCTHPAWTDKITLSPDGTFVRDVDGGAGHWTLAGLQGQVILVLAWNDWSPETATMIGPDEFRGKIHTRTHDGELVMRRVQSPNAVRAQAPTKPASNESVTILAASYSFGSQYADVTKRVQDLLRQGHTFQANPACLLTDPQPGWNKCLVIFCEVRGKRAIISVGEGEDVSHDLLLKKARPVTEEAVANEAGSYPVDIRFSGSQTPDDIRHAGIFSNPGDCSLIQAGDHLALTVPGGTVHDLFGGRLNSPTALTSVEGDFMVQAKVSGIFDPGSEPAQGFPRAFHGAGLLVFEDKDNYVRFERAEMVWKDDHRHVYWHPLVQQKLRGVYDEFMGPDNSFTPVFTDPATMLRLERTGNTMFAFISPDDGRHWNQVARFETNKAKRVLVGVSASNTSAQAFKPVFVGLTVTPLVSDGTPINPAATPTP